MSTGQWLDRVVGTGEEDPKALRENPRNWRVHPGKQQAAMRDILEEVGVVQQVLVNRRTGTIIDGHMRVALALKHGQAAIPVSYVEMDEDEEATVLATLNPLGALAYEDAEARAQVAAAVESDRASLRALLGIPETGDSGTEAIADGDDRDGMTKDHTKAIAEGDDPDLDGLWDESAWEDDAYTGEAIKLISFVMTAAEYGDVIDALEAVADREGVETNADVVIWLIGRYAPEGDERT